MSAAKAHFDLDNRIDRRRAPRTRAGDAVDAFEHGEDADQRHDVARQQALDIGIGEAPQVSAERIDDAVERLVGDSLALVAATLEHDRQADRGARLCCEGASSALLPMPEGRAADQHGLPARCVRTPGAAVAARARDRRTAILRTDERRLDAQRGVSPERITDRSGGARASGAIAAVACTARSSAEGAAAARLSGAIGSACCLA